MLANLLALEKKTRLAADAKSTVVVCQAILTACHQCGDFAALNEQLSILTKRRAQLQKAVEAVIQQGAKIAKELDVSTPAGEQRQRELIETLRTVSAGKMFVELERAQLTQILAAQEEKAGRVREAADILQEIQVRQTTRTHSAFTLLMRSCLLQLYAHHSLVVSAGRPEGEGQTIANPDQSWRRRTAKRC